MRITRHAQECVGMRRRGPERRRFSLGAFAPFRTARLPALAFVAVLSGGATMAETAALTPPPAPGGSPAILAEDLRAHVALLASDAMEGRKTGAPGGRLAEEYVAAVFRDLGLEPAGIDGSFFHRFEFADGVEIGPASRLTLLADGRPTAFELDNDWRPLGFSAIGELAPSCVVFAGYGLRYGREGEAGRYDSYAALLSTETGASGVGRVAEADAKPLNGCWSLVWRGAPPLADQARRSDLLGVAGIGYKASVARSLGAAGLIVADGPGAGYFPGLPALNFNTRVRREPFPVLAIGGRALGSLLRGGGLDPDAEAAAHGASEAPGAARRLPDVAVAANIDLIEKRLSGRNVLARLRMGGGDSAPVVIGAHLDHLGRGGSFASLANINELNQIHYGADDNASGVAALLEIAEHVAEQRARDLSAGLASGERDIVFAAWMGEEFGLLGSAAYVRDLKKAAGARSLDGLVSAYLNMDMVGRLRTELRLSGLGSSEVWEPEIEPLNDGLALPVVRIENAYLPTDATSFFLSGAPILSFSTGVHDDYHSPRDRTETLNFEGLARVAELARRFLMARAEAEEPPAYLAMSAERGRSRRRKNAVYLGVAPQYRQGAEPGVGVQGVVAGGPADEAGVRPGDRLLSIGGRSLDTMFDFARILNELRPGDRVDIAIRRDGAVLRRKITPRLRE